MTAAEVGTVGVLVTAGHLIPNNRQVTPIGYGFTMGDHADLTIYFTPDVAAQWIHALTTITNEKESN